MLCVHTCVQSIYFHFTLRQLNLKSPPPPPPPPTHVQRSRFTLPRFSIIIFGKAPALRPYSYVKQTRLGGATYMLTLLKTKFKNVYILKSIVNTCYDEFTKLVNT